MRLSEGSIDGKEKAACVGSVVEGRCEESAGVCEEPIVGHSGGEEVASVAGGGGAEGDGTWNQVSIGYKESALDCCMGEPHCGERRYTEVSAGPRAKQDCAATRRQRTECGRRIRES